jgi:NAD(P)-dependent dehydrogenase (short-subunit alcohol dehydrogenase family)
MPQTVVFDPSRHQRFAALSADVNPVHTDALAARRTQFGEPIVHGVHSLLRVLDTVAAVEPELRRATSVKAKFLRAVYVGDSMVPEITSRGPSRWRVRGSVDGQDVVAVAIGFGSPAQLSPLGPGVARTLPPLTQPLNLPPQQMLGYGGQVAYSCEGWGQLFPHAVECFGAQRIGALACSSYIVGMLVPGLYSMFFELDVSLAERNAAPALSFLSGAIDPDFRSLQIEVRGGGIGGTLRALHRLPPAQQPALESIAVRVQPGEFSDARALVVGGSRGLGELTAKILAAGDAEVTITYAAGVRDADTVASELTAAGKRCNVVRYDVREPAAPQLRAIDSTHVYYFPTPSIFRRKAGFYDPVRRVEFEDFYVKGFANLIEACPHPETLRVFYPSSVAVAFDQRPPEMLEYAMAKAAGEILCEELARRYEGMRVITTRLPRLPTDQTASVMQVDTADPVEVLLSVVREMHGAGAD